MRHSIRLKKKETIIEIVKYEARFEEAVKALLRELEARLQCMGCAYIAIDVFGPNRSALEFYRRNGYALRNAEVMKPIP